MKKSNKGKLIYCSLSSIKHDQAEKISPVLKKIEGLPRLKKICDNTIKTDKKSQPQFITAFNSKGSKNKKALKKMSAHLFLKNNHLAKAAHSMKTVKHSLEKSFFDQIKMAVLDSPAKAENGIQHTSLHRPKGYKKSHHKKKASFIESLPKTRFLRKRRPRLCSSPFSQSVFDEKRKTVVTIEDFEERKAQLPFDFNLPFSETRIDELIELLKNPEFAQVILYALALDKQATPLSLWLKKHIILPEELAEIALIGEGSASETILSVLRKNKYFELATKISNKIRNKRVQIARIKAQSKPLSSFFRKEIITPATTTTVPKQEGNFRSNITTFRKETKEPSNPSSLTTQESLLKKNATTWRK